MQHQKCGYWLPDQHCCSLTSQGFPESCFYLFLVSENQYNNKWLEKRDINVDKFTVQITKCSMDIRVKWGRLTWLVNLKIDKNIPYCIPYCAVWRFYVMWLKPSPLISRSSHLIRTTPWSPGTSETGGTGIAWTQPYSWALWCFSHGIPHTFLPIMLQKCARTMLLIWHLFSSQIFSLLRKVHVLSPKVLYIEWMKEWMNFPRAKK